MSYNKKALLYLLVFIVIILFVVGMTFYIQRKSTIKTGNSDNFRLTNNRSNIITFFPTPKKHTDMGGR